MKRVLRDVMVGAMTGVAAVSASVLAAQPAMAQDAARTPQPARLSQMFLQEI